MLQMSAVTDFIKANLPIVALPLGKATGDHTKKTVRDADSGDAKLWETGNYPLALADDEEDDEEEEEAAMMLGCFGLVWGCGVTEA